MSTLELPLVSIVMPAYNVEAYIEDSLESIRLQRWPRWELHIVDDGSTDKTSELARVWAPFGGHRKEVYVWSEPHRGIAGAFNWAARRVAHGSLLMACPADDLLHPDYLMECVTALREQPDVTVAYSNVADFDEVPSVVHGKKRREWGVWAPVFNPDTLHEQNTIPGCAVFRRELFDRLGGWPIGFTHGCEDWAFWVQCNERRLLMPVRIDQPLYRHRVREGSLTSQIEPHMPEIREQIAALAGRTV